MSEVKPVRFKFVPKPEMSLTQFIEENHKLLAVIGVLTALSVFWSNSPLTAISSFISFLCLTASVPLYFEIWRKYLKANVSLPVAAFMYSITPMMTYTFWYTLVRFRPQWETEMIGVITFTLVFIFAFVIDKLRVTERFVMRALEAHRLDFFRISKWPTEDQTTKAWNELAPTLFVVTKGPTFLNAAIVLLLLVLCIYPAGRLAPLVNRQLDRAREKYAAEEVKQQKKEELPSLPSAANPPKVSAQPPAESNSSEQPAGN